MGYKNLTIRGKTDGFGCQWNAKLSGMAVCYNSGGRLRYVHSPFTTVSHCWNGREEVEAINKFVGVPDNRVGRKIHICQRFNNKVFGNPAAYYTDHVLNIIRSHYWSTEKPDPSDCEIVVHIRRGDVQPHRGGDRRQRHMKNRWYNHVLPRVVAKYPSHYKMAIYSEGKFEEFAPIIENWPIDLIDRTEFRLADPNLSFQEFDMLTAYHHFVTAKVFIMSKSGLSYTAGIFNESSDIYFVGSRARGQRLPLRHWINGWQKDFDINFPAITRDIK
jgi:hypothetical protein